MFRKIKNLFKLIIINQWSIIGILPEQIIVRNQIFLLTIIKEENKFYILYLKELIYFPAYQKDYQEINKISFDSKKTLILAVQEMKDFLNRNNDIIKF